MIVVWYKPTEKQAPVTQERTQAMFIYCPKCPPSSIMGKAELPKDSMNCICPRCKKRYTITIGEVNSHTVQHIRLESKRRYRQHEIRLLEAGTNASCFYFRQSESKPLVTVHPGDTIAVFEGYMNDGERDHRIVVAIKNCTTNRLHQLADLNKIRWGISCGFGAIAGLTCAVILLTYFSKVKMNDVFMVSLGIGGATGAIAFRRNTPNAKLTVLAKQQLEIEWGILSRMLEIKSKLSKVEKEGSNLEKLREEMKNLREKQVRVELVDCKGELKTIERTLDAVESQLQCSHNISERYEQLISLLSVLYSATKVDSSLPTNWSEKVEMRMGEIEDVELQLSTLTAQITELGF